MNREIKFRGKRKDDDEWCYGYYCTNGPEHRILEMDEDGKGFIVDDVEVIPETVGQYTGLKDKDGVEVYEGDIVESERYKIPCIVEYHSAEPPCHAAELQAGFRLKEVKGQCVNISDFRKCKVIGNITDNPELMGGE